MNMRGALLLVSAGCFAAVACAEDTYVLSKNDADGGQGGGSETNAASSVSIGTGGADPTTTSAGGAPGPECGPEASQCVCGEMESCECGGLTPHCDMYCGGECFLICAPGGFCSMHCGACDAFCDFFSQCSMECLSDCTLVCAPGAICEVLPGPGFVTLSCSENATCFCSDEAFCLCEGEGCQPSSQ